MIKTFLIAGAALALTAGAACAQPTKAAKLDANGDGKVSKAEFTMARSARLMKLDADGDGRVSKAEFDARAAKRAAKAPEGAAKPKGDGSRMFGMLDANRDGSLDRAEIGKLAERRFGRLDADGNGELTSAELQAARQGAGGMAGDDQ